MAVTRLKVNPTRMELRRLKDRLKTAVRGHKLLKDKSDEMIRRFVELAKRNLALRKQVEQALAGALSDFVLAKAVSDDYVIQQALAMPAARMQLQCGTQNIMSVVTPTFEIVQGEQKELFPYAFGRVTAQLDDSIRTISGLANEMIELAQVEKACNILAIEIEKNRRRVNALEYIMIPQIEETIRYITMKLDENERGNIVRLMKVKDILAQK